MSIENIGKGAILDTPDIRDYKYEEVMGAITLPENYNVLDELPYKIKVETQWQSLSCVGQAVSKYVEVLNYFDEKKERDASAKFVYSRIYQPQGGASIRDGISIPVSDGVCEEAIDPSYDNGQPPSEVYMRIKNESPLAIENAKIYQVKEYRTIWHQENIETIKQAIYQNKGVVSGFRGDNEGWGATDGIVYPPKSLDPWGHAVYLVGWEIIGNETYIKFINSWGNQWGRNGLGLIHPSYWKAGGMTFNLWTLVDKPNKTLMDYLIVGKNQFLVYEPYKIAISIGDEQELTKLQLRGLTGQPTSKDNLDGYLIYPGTDIERFKDLLNV